MLHCLVFKEQLFVFRSSPSFETLCFKRLIYCTASLLDCQELFYFSFLSERQPIASCKLFPLKEPCLAFHASRYLAATCIILQELRPFVNSYLELFSRFFNCSRCCPWIRKKHRLRDAHLHMAGVAGLEPTHAGFRDPCLTNLAIPLCLQRIAVNESYYIASRVF